MAIAAVSLIVFTLVGVCTLQLQLASGAEQREQAFNLAESALHLAIAEMVANGTYGTHSENVVVTCPDSPADSYGRVTFAAGSGQRRSTNNLAVRTAVPGDGRSVPPETAHLIGRGVWGAMRAEVECLFYRPSFPTGLVTGGNVTGSGLFLAGVAPGTPITASLASLPAEELRPADLHSNASGVAVNLEPECTISGDVGAVGTIQLSDDTTVRGEVRPGSPPQTVPTFDLGAVRARLAANNIIPQPATSSAGSQTLNWFTESSGDLTVGGDLTLDNGVLFVNGVLRVQGILKGRGLVMATGDVFLARGSDLESRDVLALGTRGNLTITGQDQRHTFHGLLYAEGDLVASDLTVLGSIVAKRTAHLTNVRMLQTDVSSTLRFGLPMLHRNDDDALFWVVNPRLDEGTGEVRYDYYMALYLANGKDANDRAASLVGQDSGQNLTRDELMTAMLTFADSDWNPEQDPSEEGHVPGPHVPLSEILTGVLPGYLDGLTGAGTSTFTVDFDLNKLLSEVERSRVLMWRRL